MKQLCLYLFLCGFLLSGCAKEEHTEHDADHNHGNESGHSHEEKGGHIVSTIISSENLRKAGVRIEESKHGSINSSISIPGVVISDPEATVALHSQVRGYFAEVKKTLGDNVQKGELLAVLISRELAEIQGEFIRVTRRLELDKEVAERAKKLHDQKLISDQEYSQSRIQHQETLANAEAAHQRLLALGFSHKYIEALPNSTDKQLSRYEIRSPLRGTIVSKNIAKGDAITSEESLNQTLFLIADLTKSYVKLSVSKNQDDGIRVGQRVRVQSNDTTKYIYGTLATISKTVDPGTQALDVRVVFENVSNTLRPGQYVTAYVESGSIQADIVIPRESIQQIEGKDIVFVKNADTLEAHEVVLGKHDDQNVEIVKGLTRGDSIVTRNSYIIKADIGKSSAAHEH